MRNEEERKVKNFKFKNDMLVVMGKIKFIQILVHENILIIKIGSLILSYLKKNLILDIFKMSSYSFYCHFLIFLVVFVGNS